MLLLNPPQMVRLLGSQPLKHPPAAATFGFLRSIRVKRIAAAFDGEREFERVADDGGFEAWLFVEGFEFPLLPEAGFSASDKSWPGRSGALLSAAYRVFLPPTDGPSNPAMPSR